jgi:hypothetical protein
LSIEQGAIGAFEQQVLVRLQPRNLVPLDVDRSHVVGAEPQPIVFESLDFAGQAIAIDQDDDVGFRRGHARCDAASSQQQCAHEQQQPSVSRICVTRCAAMRGRHAAFLFRFEYLFVPCRARPPLFLSPTQ